MGNRLRTPQTYLSHTQTSTMMPKHKHLPSQLFEKRRISEQGQGLRDKFFSKPHRQYFYQILYFLLLTPFFSKHLWGKKNLKKEWYPGLKELNNSREDVLGEDASSYVLHQDVLYQTELVHHIQFLACSKKVLVIESAHYQGIFLEHSLLQGTTASLWWDSQHQAEMFCLQLRPPVAGWQPVVSRLLASHCWAAGASISLYKFLYQ